MSVLVSTDNGFVISHDEFIRKTYSHVEKDGFVYNVEYKPAIFRINTPFKKNLEAQKAGEMNVDEKSTWKRKRKRSPDASNATAQRVQERAKSLMTAAREKGLFSHLVSNDNIIDNNSEARTLSDNFYKIAGRFQMPTTFSGANATPKARLEVVGGEQYIFPKESHFFCNDIWNMHEKTEDLGTFDLIVIDPPWWNKYIRRKKAHDEVDGYKMLSCDSLSTMPIAKLLQPGALVAVWCTNSDNHLSDLKDCLMPAWGIKHVASWCWLKVTTSGEPVCPYSKPPGKQPFEQLLLGIETNACKGNRSWPYPDNEQLLLSVPSAVHSHKPPLLDVLKPLLPPEPRCLEIFARSLLPGCTSWGLEVLKLQHISLFSSKKLKDNSSFDTNLETSSD